jgi:hypothetical protein
MGLVTADGSPTDRYKEIRNPDKAGKAFADSMRVLYSDLFDMNEYVYELDNTKLKALIVEATGAEAGSTPVKKTLATFCVLNKLADFESSEEEDVSISSEEPFENNQIQQNTVPVYQSPNQNTTTNSGINLSYTINLNLPATTDINVFNAIFKSLKQHLLQD